MIQEKLDRFLNNENRFDGGHFGLRDISALLDHFGNPHRNVPAFHVAGTNGKGSVSHMLAAICASAGYRTGLYTSPHLLDINERIRLQGEPIDDRIFEDYVDEITAYVDADGSIAPTYFDVLTVCAFRYFSDIRADCAVIETGLGGRLDSTNVITPVCSIITEISLDHVGILGKTLTAISSEKAGIIKDGIPVVTSNTDTEILGPIMSAAASGNAPVFLYTRDFIASNIIETEQGFRFDYSSATALSLYLSGLEVPHPLKKQVANACCAITAAAMARSKLPMLTDSAIRSGLASFSVAGRFQTLCRKPLIIFDPAHNEAALNEMIGLLEHKFSAHDITLVVSIMKDKEIHAIMTMLNAKGIKAVYYVLDDPRCYVPGPGDYPEVIMEIIGPDENGLATRLDSRISENSLFFFTGSFRLYRSALNYGNHAGIKCS